MSKYSKEELERLILDEGLSYEEIGRRFEVTGNAIRKTAARLGIELPRRRNINAKEAFNRGVSLLDKICDEQFLEIINTSTGWDEIISKIGYKINGSNTRDNILNRCKQLQVQPTLRVLGLVMTRTKGDLFVNRKNWQSARGTIQKEARRLYFDNNAFPKCEICGYTNHVEVAHIKAVSEFSNDISISEINALSNLVGLCPNHHWEYDNGILTL